MKRASKLFLCFMLSLCMITTTVPMNVFADVDGGNGGDIMPVLPETQCICEEKCTEDAINLECPVCNGEEGISACVGIELVHIDQRVLWIDNGNNDKSRPSGDDYLKVLKIKATHADGTVEYIDAEGLVKYTDYGDGNEGGELIVDLPKYDDNDEEIEYEFVQDPEKTISDLRYILTENPEHPDWLTNIQALELDVKVRTFDGANIKDGEHPDFLKKAFESENNPLIVARDGQEYEIDATVGNKWTYDGETATGTYSFMTLPKYSLDEHEYNYTVTIASESEDICGRTDDFYKDGDDWYRVIYDNTEVDNRGNITDKVYNGGTIELTLRNKLEYNATKVWLDGGREDLRPEVSFELWRYTKIDDKSYQQASPVRDGDEKVVFDIPCKGTFEDLEVSTDADAMYRLTNDLDKYDPKGYEYVYLLREKMTGGKAEYEILLDPDVERNENGGVSNVTEHKRSDKDDDSIYNGGVVANRITGSISKDTTKSWIAQAYIDDIGDVEVAMSLEYRNVPTGSSSMAETPDWTPYLDKDGKPVVESKDGFNSVTPEQTWSASLPKYDAEGRELQYRWIETAVTQDDQNKLDKENQTFVLKQNEENMYLGKDSFNVNGKTYRFKRQNEEHFDSIETKNGSIVNKVTGKEDYLLIKKWNNVDGTHNAPEGAKAAFVITNDQGLPDITVEMDGKTETRPEQGNVEGEGYEEVTAYEEQPWIVHVENLPKYTDDGARIIYMALEAGTYVDKDGTEYLGEVSEVNAKERYSVIVNGPGEGMRVPVTKLWVDDEDAACRYDSFVTLVFKKGTNDEVDFYEEYGKYVQLSELENGWFEYIGVDQSFINSHPGADKLKNYELREIALKDLDPEEGYPVENTTQYQDERGVETVTTDNHMYVTEYGQTKVGNVTALSVTNRRVGTVDVEASKVWWDDGMDPEKRPYPMLKLVVTSENKGVTYDEKGVYVEGVKSVKLPTILPVSRTTKSGETSYYHFDGLPKYDAEGKVITYSVSEYFDRSKETEKTETHYETSYSSSYIPNWMAPAPYDGQNESVEEFDKQILDVENKRQQNIDVTFYKEWKDAYAATQGFRPDIYMELYSTKSIDEDGNLKEGYTSVVPAKVGYRTNKWTDDDRANRQDPNKYWKITFAKQPRYDDRGALITYYGLESTNIDASPFDYTAQKYKDKELNFVTLEGEDFWVESASDGKTVLQEDGTFVNPIEKRVHLKGKKEWEGVPVGYDGELPMLDVYLYRYEQGDSSAEAIEDKKTYEQVMMPDPDNPDEEIPAMIKGVETPDGERTIQFSFYYDEEEGDSIPNHCNYSPEKYNDEGTRYVYVFQEYIYKTSNSSSDQYDLTDVYTHKTDTAFVLENVYPGDNYNGEIKIYKSWEDRPAGSTYTYPKTTFTVKQVYVNSHNHPTTVDYTSKTISAAQWKSNPDTVVTFDKKLPLYAPDGFKYMYYVEETAIYGYNKSKTSIIPAASFSNVTPVQGAWSEYKAFTFNMPAKADMGEAVVATTEATPFVNDYEPESTGIYGYKDWNDDKNAFATRPEPKDVQLTVYRYALSQSGQNNGIASASNPIKLDPQPKVIWTSTTTDSWQWAFDDLDKWAPNGTKWIYRVKEEITADGYKDNYKQTRWWSTSTSNPESDPDKKGTGQAAGTQTNHLSQRVGVVKQWDEKEYDIKPVVYFELQVKIGSGDWQHPKDAEVFKTISKDNKNTDKCPVKIDKDHLWQVKLTDTSSTATTRKYSKYFENLPAKVKVNGTWQTVNYRFVETQIDTYDVFDHHGSDTCLADPLVYPEVSTENGKFQPEVKEVKKTDSTGTSKEYTTWESTVPNKIVGGFVKLKIKKEWQLDEGYESLTRPSSITFKLQRSKDNATWQDYKDNNNKQITKSVSSSNSWQAEVNYLPKYDKDGQRWYYNAVEQSVPSAYVKINHTIDPADGETDVYVAVDTNELKTIDISGSKKWVDNNNTSKRPESITIKLKANGSVIKTTTATAPDWKWEFKQVPEMDKNGNRITYTFEEVVGNQNYNVTGFNPSSVKATDSKKAFDVQVTNTERVNISGEKLWKDLGVTDKSKIRPKSITVKLLADGKEAASKSVSQAADGTWKWTFTNMNKYDPATGDEITYTVDEIVVPDYNTEYDDDHLNITNIYDPSGEPGITYLDGSKTWNDDGNRDNKRPGKIEITLQAKYPTDTEGGYGNWTRALDEDGAIIPVKEVTEGDGWKWSFDDLPRFKFGNEIQYRVQEKAVGEYTTTYDENGADIKNTHPNDPTTVSGSKTWRVENQSSIPQSITVNLLADGKPAVDLDGKPVAAKTVTAADGWKWTFTNIPKNAAGKKGVPINYTVQETAVAGFAANYDAFGKNITNVELTSVSGEKIWKDRGVTDKSKIRPKSITVRLKADGKEVASKSVSQAADGSWKWTFDKLPKYTTAGTKIKYTVDEDVVPNYTTAYDSDHLNITNTYEPSDVYGSLDGVKTWNDDGNRDNKRPKKIEITLMAKYPTDGDGGYGDWTRALDKDGKAIAVKDVTEDDDWTWSFTKLPKYKYGNTILYKVQEKAIGEYTTTYDENGADVKNTHPNDPTTVSGSKTWRVEDESLIPESITVKLLADGKPAVDLDGEPVAAKTVTADDDWKWEFTNIPKNAAGKVGVPIEYTVEEEAVDGFVAGYDDSGKNVTNVQLISLDGEKTWKDYATGGKTRPMSIYVSLWATTEKDKAAGKDPVAVKVDDDNQIEVKPNEDGEWKWTFDNLPKYTMSGEEIEYSVTEEKVFDYEVRYEDGTLNITNVFNPDEPTSKYIDITGVKTWNDEDNQDGLRPQKVIIKLYKAVGEEGAERVPALDEDGNQYTAVATKATNWEWMFTDLNKYEEGYEVDYSIEEEVVKNYSTEIVKDEAVENSYEVINTHEVELTKIAGKKTWKDNNDALGQRPDSITINLLADGKPAKYQDGSTVKAVTVTADDNWKYSFEDLPKYKKGAQGKEIKYTITENEVAHYTSEVNGYNVTNTIIPPDEKPKTGDDTNVGLLAGLMMAALTGMGGALFARRRKNA